MFLLHYYNSVYSIIIVGKFNMLHNMQKQTRNLKNFSKIYSQENRLCKQAQELTNFSEAYPHENRLCRAFTLAEVLITLGIIGVVAAMTMPVLIQKNRANVVETRLQKFYSMINQSLTMAELDYGNKSDWTPADTQEFFNKYLKNYLKYLKTESKRVGTSNDFLLVYLADGSSFLVDIYGVWDDEGNQTFKSNGGHFIFCPYAKDCTAGNDKKKWGKKQFVFGYWPGGDVAAKYHKDKGVEPYLNQWDGNESTLYTNSGFGCNKDAGNFYCTAIIQHNGWKIPKDYPYKF